MSANPPLPTPEEVWRRYDADEARLTAPLSARMIALAGLRPGMRVLDLATGRGEPAVRAARAVAPLGSVLGIDVAPAMLAMARERADREGVTNLELREGDAGAMTDAELPPGTFDATLARWGLMFMASPLAALAAAHRAMRPHAPLVAAVWTEPERATFFTLPRRVLDRHRRIPADAEGVFRYADSAQLGADLAAAGFAVAQSESTEVALMEAATDQELVAWVRAFGLSRLMVGLDDAAQAAWEQDFLEAAAPLWRDGVIRLGGVTRLVVARAMR